MFFTRTLYWLELYAVTGFVYFVFLSTNVVNDVGTAAHQRCPTNNANTPLLILCHLYEVMQVKSSSKTATHNLMQQITWWMTLEF